MDNLEKNTVFSDACERFNGIAEVYARHRPGYPAACARFLIEAARLDHRSVVADIGSGTGIFSTCLLGEGLRVIGVEPNDDMRIESDTLLAGRARFSSKKGTAEATGLPASCVDLVTAAQSFHWFDKKRFRAECRRILHVDGPVAVIWNQRETENDLARGLIEVCMRHCPRFEALEIGIPRSKNEYPEFFRDGAYVSRIFRNDLVWDWPAFVGRSLSSSFSPRKGDPAYPPFVADLRALFERHQQKDGTVQVANVTLCYLGRV